MAAVPRVVLMMSASAGYERGLLRGIARYAQHHGPWVVFLAGEQPGVPLPSAEVLAVDASARRPSLRRASGLDLRGLGATGVIGRLHTPQIVKTVLASKLPVIALDLTDQQLADGSPLRRVSEILPDSRKAGCLAAEHLLDRGFRRFAFCGYLSENWSRRREEGFAAVLRQAGFGYEKYPAPAHKTRPPWHREQPRVTAWLKSLATPVGILACNDSRGRQLIEACAMGGLHVPTDVAVVGVDEDRLLSELSNPPLSSVALNAEHSGYQAAELLDGLMAGRIRPPQRILVDALWVVPRASSDVIAVEDREVARALTFLRDQARRPIGVQDVVAQASVSRRALEIRFQRSLGRSIREEIQRVRLEWAKQLLVETNLPVWKIAQCTGFSNYNYLSRVFHRVTGLTLAGYRRSHLAG